MSDQPWHALTTADALAALGTSPLGLGAAEVEARRLRTGDNRLIPPRGRPGWVVFLTQFRSPLVMLLAVAAIVSLTLGQLRDAAIISAILLFNSAIGFNQERQAAQAMAALRSLVRSTCRVIRDGEEIEITVADVVVGDIIALAAGDIVPADARLIESANVKVNEAVLTGEALPAEKGIETLPEAAALPDRRNMVFRGTTVVSGRGVAVVTAAGMTTELGHIVETVHAARHDETPLQRRLAVFARGIGISVLVLVIIIFILGIFRGQSIGSMALVAIALAVAIVPEGLPIVVTLTLALGTRQMAKNKAIVRKLSAVETLGSVDIIAADKTGTLTYGEMMVEAISTLEQNYAVSGQGYAINGGLTRDGHQITLVDDPVLAEAVLAGVLCNDARVSRTGDDVSTIGDPTEIALLVLAEKLNLKPVELVATHSRTGEFPFDFLSRTMVTFHTREGGEFIAAKGAPEAILDLCGWVKQGGSSVPLTGELRRRLAAQADDLAARGLRGLAIASARRPSADKPVDRRIERGQLTYYAVVGIRDTNRPEAKDTIEKCRSAGIRVVMLTGDHRNTAEHVAVELGLMPAGDATAVIDGAELEKMDDHALALRLPALRVAARISPAQKLHLVRAFKRAGHVVAVTGDGVNDAPALVEAHIGVAVDRKATDAAKDAADILLTDGNLATIVEAVEIGRGIFQNIRRVILYLFSTNVVEAIVMLAALVSSAPLPFLPIQILWLNVISDTFLDVSIATEPVHASVMDRPPRPIGENILNRQTVARLAFLAAVMAIGTLWFISAVANRAVTDELRYALGFSALAMFQWFNAINVLSEQKSTMLRTIGTNKWVLLAICFVVALHFTIVFTPALRTVFHFSILTLPQITAIFFIASSVLWMEEIRKWVLRHRPARQRP